MNTQQYLCIALIVVLVHEWLHLLRWLYGKVYNHILSRYRPEEYCPHCNQKLTAEIQGAGGMMLRLCKQPKCPVAAIQIGGM